MKNIKITADNANDEWLINFIYSEIDVGDSAEITRTLTPDDIKAFAAVSGDINPAHMDPVYSSQTLFHGIIGHGMWGGALISTVLGTVFPGPGTIYLEQILHFSRPVRIGDTLTVTVTCKSLNPFIISGASARNFTSELEISLVICLYSFDMFIPCSFVD